MNTFSTSSLDSNFNGPPPNARIARSVFATRLSSIGGEFVTPVRDKTAKSYSTIDAGVWVVPFVTKCRAYVTTAAVTSLLCSKIVIISAAVLVFDPNCLLIACTGVEFILFPKESTSQLQ